MSEWVTAVDREEASTLAGDCDCCGSKAWEYLFDENGFHLGRCGQCGLLYVSERPTDDNRLEEIEQEVFASGKLEAFDAAAHLAAERKRVGLLRRYVALAADHAPSGPWLDIGCGTGTLLELASEQGRAIEGIELSPSRRTLAETRTGATVYSKPLERLGLREGRYAAAFMINVFSHLANPSHLFGAVRDVLADDGVLVLSTSEVGSGARRHHKRSWELGDHLHFLGADTIERYAARFNYEVVHRERVWEPELLLSRAALSIDGRSQARNLLKRAILMIPGAYPLFKGGMYWRQRDNPIYRSHIVLKACSR